MLSVLLTSVAAPLDPVVVSDVMRLVYAVSHSVCLVVVGIEYPLCKDIAIVPLDVIGEPLTLNPVGTLTATLVTVPTLQDLSALRSYAVPFIVKVRLVGTAPNVVVVIASHTGAALLVPSPV